MNSDSPIESTDKLLAVLGEVHDPIFERPLSALGSLQNAALDGRRASVKVRISSPAEELKQKLGDALRAKATAGGLEELEIEWDVQIPTREATSEDPIPEVKNVVLVMSGKGGVGKSTVAANLTLALKRRGMRVGLLDADIYGPSVPTMLGISGHPMSKDGKRIIPLERFGVKLMSVGFLLEDPTQAIVWRGPMLHGALQQFISDVEWGALDYLIIDMPPGTGDVALSLAQKAKITGVVVVTTPQEVALQDVYKGVSMTKKLNLETLGVVENMSYFVDPAGNRHELFGSGGGDKVAEFAGSEVLGRLPIEPEVREWGDKGTPIVQAAPNTQTAQVFLEIADKLTEKVAASHFARGGGEKAPDSSGPKRLRILR
ncbi:MAG: Mrp/NBP35 family ATP-binding protein [Sandaracinaceae bacterium]|nr:Mrp/NBP35 family ATP-binding protein [Sandaracinaceae bacterium]